MDTETRKERARLIMNLTERIHDSQAECPPILAMWIAILTGMSSARFHEGNNLTPVVSLTSTDLAPADVSLSPFLWANAPEWLGLDKESASEMLQPEHVDADWRARVNKPGYISLYATSKMLKRYGETGEVNWPTAKPELPSWESICLEHGIAWAVWQSAPTGGWRPPGTERTAIVKFQTGREPGISKFDIEKHFSDKAGCRVRLIYPEQISDRRRAEELNKAEVLYGQPE